MRSRKDLKTVRFKLFGSVQLDMERVEQDPAWMMAGRHFDVSDPEQFDLAMVDYLKYYLGREQLLAEMPATTGPAELYGLEADGPNRVAKEFEEVRAASSRRTCTKRALRTKRHAPSSECRRSLLSLDEFGMSRALGDIEYFRVKIAKALGVPSMFADESGDVAVLEAEESAGPDDAGADEAVVVEEDDKKAPDGTAKWPAFIVDIDNFYRANRAHVFALHGNVNDYPDNTGIRGDLGMTMFTRYDKFWLTEKVSQEVQNTGKKVNIQAPQGDQYRGALHGPGRLGIRHHRQLPGFCGDHPEGPAIRRGEGRAVAAERPARHADPAERLLQAVGDALLAEPAATHQAGGQEPEDRRAGHYHQGTGGAAGDQPYGVVLRRQDVLSRRPGIQPDHGPDADRLRRELGAQRRHRAAQQDHPDRPAVAGFAGIPAVRRFARGGDPGEAADARRAQGMAGGLRELHQDQAGADQWRRPHEHHAGRGPDLGHSGEQHRRHEPGADRRRVHGELA